MVEARKPRGLLAGLTLAVVVGIVALVLSVQNALELGEQSDQRNADRIASDLRACERGNDLRRQIVVIGEANVALTDGILDTIFGPNPDRSPESQAAIDALRASLDPLFDRYGEALDKVDLTDCATQVPGA